MLHFPRWQIILILAVVTAGFLAVIPNFFSKEMLAAWPTFLPKQQMVLGLDLQGGAYLLYEVDQADYKDKRLRTLVGDVRKAMLENPRIGYTGLGAQGDTVQLRIRDLDRMADVKTRLDPLRNPLNQSLLSAGSVYEFDLRHRPAIHRGHRPAHQRTRHDRAFDPAPGRRPHPRRGPGSG